LLAALDGRLTLHCVDACAEMLAELDRRLSGDYEGRYTIIHGTVEEVRFAPGACDAVFSFNALHHFDLPRALRNIAAWLRPGGLAFLYTRTPAQNARNLWGRHFPGFVEKEDRLKGRATLLAAVGATPGLRWVETKRFAYSRRADLDAVLDKVDRFHYSTFRLYRGDELEVARELFLNRLVDAYSDPDDIFWTDYNMMLVVEKSEEERI
jgi:SAM-dependent methyltransferase